MAEAPIVQDDGTVLYVTEDQDLFSFNGQQSQFVADHVSELVKTASNQVIVRFSDGNIDNIDLSNPTVLRSATSGCQQELIAFNRLDTNTNNADSHWIYLCYYREQVGQTTDYASYEQAVANANMALQNAQERYTQNLYIFKDGKNTLLTDEALNIEPCNQAVIYDTVSMLRQRYQASASLNTNELFSNMASLSDSYANGILPLGRTKPLTCGSSLSPNQWVFRQNGCEIYAAGDHLYSLCDGTLYGAELSGDTITGVTAISNNHPLVMVGADQRLYFVVGDSSGTIFDLYVCEGKKPGLIVSGIALQHILTYEDGAVIYTTADGQVSMCLPNKTQFSSPANAELLCRLDGNSMLYRVNGTLVLNRNGEETELRNNALFFWPAVPLSCGRCVSFDYPFRSSWN